MPSTFYLLTSDFCLLIQAALHAVASNRLPIDFRRLAWASRLACDYVHEFTRLEPFFAGDPRSLEGWRAAIERRHRYQPKCSIAPVVQQQLTRRRAPEPARRAATRLEDPAAIAIVTGQQAGVFGGPAYTLLKALTAIKLAARVESEYGVQTVPVFWIDAEDHDLDEVRSATVLDADLQPRQMSLTFRSAPGTPCSAVRLDSSVSATIDHLAATLQPTEFTSALVDEIRAAYAPGTGLAEAFARWLDGVLGPLGLVVFDSSDSTAKPCAQWIFQRELESAGETSRRAAAAGAELVAKGYHAQVSPTPDGVALFHVDGLRQPIRLRRHGSELMVGDTTVSREELLKLAATQPTVFSPNVLLRPIIQDALFPTVAYVAGPNELAYLAQLKDVYLHFGVPMPMFFPRLSATVVDSAAVKFLNRYDVPFEALQPRDEAALNRLLASQLPDAVERALSAADDAVRTRMATLAQAVPVIDPTLAGAVDSTLGRMEHDLRNLHGKIIQAAKRRDETLRRQFHRAQAQAFPDGHPQERTLASVYFLNRYGPALTDRLVAELDLDVTWHWVIAI